MDNPTQTELQLFDLSLVCQSCQLIPNVDTEIIDFKIPRTKGIEFETTKPTSSTIRLVICGCIYHQTSYLGLQPQI